MRDYGMCNNCGNAISSLRAGHTTCGKRCRRQLSKSSRAIRIPNHSAGSHQAAINRAFELEPFTPSELMLIQNHSALPLY